MATVVIQAGHCFRHTGATGTGGLDGDPTEQEFTWAAANRCAALLRVAGHQAHVILADVSSDKYQGDAFCAIHCDGSTSRSARGASVGYRNDQGKRLASAWKQAYYDLGWRGFRADNYTAALAGYYGVRNAVGQGNGFAFIAEAGFLTSPDDERLLSGSAGTERFARALTNAVVSIFGGHTSSPPPEEEDMTPAQATTLDNIAERLVRMEKDLTAVKDRAPGYFAKDPAATDGVVYYVDVSHQSKVSMPVGGKLHELLKFFHASGGHEVRAVELGADVLAGIPDAA